MSFLTPAYLWLLAAVAALAAAYVVLQARRRHVAVRFTNLALLDSLAPRRPGWRRHVVAAAALVGLASMVVALARPVRDEKVPREEAVVMLVVDVSASMAAEDVEPTRLAAASVAAADFVDDLPDGFQVGLVSFDGTARLLASPSTDRATVVRALQNLRTGPGTAAGDGVLVALDAIDRALAATTGGAAGTGGAGSGDGSSDEAPAATIVLLSDGATTAGRPLTEAAQAAVDAGVPITTIAYGTDEGTVVVQGEQVAVPADTTAMEELADATGGTSFTAGSAAQLGDVYDDIQARVGFEEEQREVLRFFVGIAIVALVLAVAGSLLWTARFL